MKDVTFGKKVDISRDFSGLEPICAGAKDCARYIARIGGILCWQRHLWICAGAQRAHSSFGGGGGDDRRGVALLDT